VRQFLDRVQGVEEEVRLELELQEVKLRARQLRLEHMRAQRPVEVPSVRGDGATGEHHGQVREQVHVRPEHRPRP
jgi:hypothetical protein